MTIGFVQERVAVAVGLEVDVLEAVESDMNLTRLGAAAENLS